MDRLDDRLRSLGLSSRHPKRLPEGNWRRARPLASKYFWKASIMSAYGNIGLWLAKVGTATETVVNLSFAFEGQPLQVMGMQLCSNLKHRPTCETKRLALQLLPSKGMNSRNRTCPMLTHLLLQFTVSSRDPKLGGAIIIGTPVLPPTSQTESNAQDSQFSGFQRTHVTRDQFPFSSSISSLYSG